MTRQSAARIRAVFAVIVASATLAGCAQKVGVTRVRLSERECLARAMYFESNRSSDAGMLAVGTVVMNRVKSGKYGATVCEVVGAPRQFAPGVLTRQMSDSGAPRARRVADAVLSGRRHPAVQNAQFFHTAGYTFPYKNMRYVLVAGGNAFYDKTKAPKTWNGGEGRWAGPPPPTERIDGGPIMLANVEVLPDEGPSRRLAPAPAIETRMAQAAPRRGGSVAGVPLYEAPPSARDQEIRVASADVPQRPRSAYGAAPARVVAIREDNGLREEDRWRDRELAQDAGVAPAESGDDWSRRRDASVETTPLPAVSPVRGPAAPRSSRIATRERAVSPDNGSGLQEDVSPSYGAQTADLEQTPSRSVRMASRAPRTVDPRQRPVAADSGASGWAVGPQPVRTEREDVRTADYSPLSNAASEAGYDIDPEPRRPARKPADRPTRAYDGVTLGGGDQVQYGGR